MEYVWAISLVAGAVLCWGLNAFQIPGSNWLMIVLCVLYVWRGPDAGPLALGWGIVAVLVVLAALGELVEFLAGALGTKRAGGSRRAAVLAMVGSIVGGLVGMFIAIPIPVVGPLLGAILFAGAGALGGALLGERWKGREWTKTWEVGKAAFWGRLLGTVGKVLAGSVMIVVVVAALVLE